MLCQGSVKALLRLSWALLRLFSGSVKALLRLHPVHLRPYLKTDVEVRPRVMVAVAPVCECEALSYVANLRSAASSWVTVVSVCGLTLLVHEALSYQCMRPSATCAALPLACRPYATSV